MTADPNTRSKPAETLRDRHTEATRGLILDAAVDLLGQSGAFEFSFSEIARRAGVSVRTIYRHFPTRDALFAEMGHRVDERVGLRFLPKDLDAVVALPAELFASFDRNEALLLAQLQTPAGAEVRARARKRRTSRIADLVDETAPDLSEAERHKMSAVIACLLSANIWKRMKDEFDLTGAEAGQAVTWALDLVAQGIRKENQAAKRKKDKEQEP